MCTIDDIQYWEDVTHFFVVDEDGYAIQEADHTDGDFNCYHCSCGEEFRDNLKQTAWQQVKEHIHETPSPALVG